MSAKEMIDKIKKCLIAGYDLDIITQEEMSILWNYITNLQDTLKDREEYCYGLETQLTNLQEENKIRQQDINNLTYQLAKEKSRIDKAVECINHYAVENEDYSKIYNDEEKDLLNILNGSDE